MTYDCRSSHELGLRVQAYGLGGVGFDPSLSSGFADTEQG